MADKRSDLMIEGAHYIEYGQSRIVSEAYVPNFTRPNADAHHVGNPPEGFSIIMRIGDAISHVTFPFSLADWMRLTDAGILEAYMRPAVSALRRSGPFENEPFEEF